MRRAILCALVTVLGAGIVVGQQAPHENEAYALEGLGLQPPPQAANGRADEIGELKAAITRLQERVNQLSVTAPPDSAPPGQTASTQANLEDGPNWRVKWRNGLQFEGLDEAFRVHVGGNVQLDAGWNSASQGVQFGPGGTGEFQDGIVFRRARVRIDGTMFQYIDWVTEYDFANTAENDTESTTQPIGSPSFTNVWVGVNQLPCIGTLRAGWMKEPLGFQYLRSGRWLDFMERTPGTSSFFERSPGVMVLNSGAEERVTWAAGVFHVQNTNFGFGTGDGQYAETGRFTCLPWYEEEGRQLLHLGIGATHRHLDNNQIRLRGRPSVRSMPGTQEPPLADTGIILGSTEEVMDVELAGVLGPWTLQSEYFCAFIHDAVYPNAAPPVGVPLGTLFYQGAYVEVLCFLTGEYQAYNRRDATFDRIVPRHNFNAWGDCFTSGAWQVGVRYSYLELQDKGVNGATLHDIVLGLNWFFNPNMKIQWNLAFDHRNSTPAGSSGWTYILGSRLALDF